MADLAEKFARLGTQDARRWTSKPLPRARRIGSSPNSSPKSPSPNLPPSGSVRHASFLGLRSDKEAKDVTPETKQAVPPPTSDVTITSRDRVIFPEAKATKGDLADYYAAIAPVMLPHARAARSASSAVRRGAARNAFSRSMTAGSFGDHVHQVPIREKDGGHEDYLYVDDADGLLACVQMGTIEFHGWGSHVDALEKPDRMVFDLDPDEGLDFADGQKGRARHPPSACRPRPGQLRDAVGRQGRPRRRAARSGPQLGRAQGFLETLCRGAEHGRARSLSSPR